MPNAMIDEVTDQIIDLVGIPKSDIIHASGKTGEGVDKILEAIVEHIPPPSGDPNAPLRALIFDSVFNSFRGVIAYYRIFNGTIRKGEKVRFINAGKEYGADEIGILQMNQVPKDQLSAGNVGYI